MSLHKAAYREVSDRLLPSSELELGYWSGRRDHVLLLTWSNRGARVSELTAIEPSPFSLGTQSFLQHRAQGAR